MLSLARVLDGLEVALDEPLAVERRRAAVGDTVPAGLHRVGVVELRSGACVRYSRYCVTVFPPRRRPRPLEPGHADVLVARAGIRVTYNGCVDLFEGLDEPLVQRLAPGDPLGASFEALLEELSVQQPGARPMAEALLKRCLILLLRRQCDHHADHVRWPAPLEDPRLRRALDTMHRRPEQAFTVLTLAEEAGMSRSAFAARFCEALGQPPMEFLKSLRLARAAQLLIRTDLPVKSIASRAGYSSRSSFTRAFTAWHHAGPAAFRLAARRATSAPRRPKVPPHRRQSPPAAGWARPSLELITGPPTAARSGRRATPSGSPDTKRLRYSEA